MNQFPQQLPPLGPNGLMGINGGFPMHRMGAGSMPWSQRNIPIGQAGMYYSPQQSMNPDDVAKKAYDAANGEGAADKAGIDTVREWMKNKAGGDPGTGKMPEQSSVEAPTTSNATSVTSNNVAQNPDEVAKKAYDAEFGEGAADKAGIDTVREWMKNKAGGTPGTGTVPTQSNVE